MLGRLGDKLDLDAVIFEVAQRVAAVTMRQRPGMPLNAISQVVERHGRGQAAVEPSGRLINGA